MRFAEKRNALRGKGEPVRTLPRQSGWTCSAAAFTLTETMAAMVLGMLMLTALYASLTFGFSTVKLSREDLRATQVLLKQIELLRITSFTNIHNFTTQDYYDPINSNANGGAVYNVTVACAAPSTADMPAQPVHYTNKMLKITATATWTNAHILRSRTIQTYVATNGIQPYVLNPH